MSFQTVIKLLCLFFCGWTFAQSIDLTAKYDRATCQSLATGEGCPKKTVIVGPNQQYRTIQSAVLSIPDNNSSWVILVQSGNYTEQVNVTRPGPLTILGQTSSPDDNTRNTVNVIWHNATAGITNTTEDNLYTSTLTIAPTLNASATGSGPDGNPVPPNTPYGNRNFRAYNLNFINAYLPYGAGPSLALSMSYANAGFYYCGFYSYQDTIYVGKLGNAYIYNSTIAGQTDFMYGFGTLWVQSSPILLRSCGGGITAWKGTNTTFVNKYGVYIHDSTVMAANSSVAASIVGKCALGRPWNAQMTSVFANTYLDQSIRPSGYIEWSSTDMRINQNTTQAVYNDYGPGYNLTGLYNAGTVNGYNITEVWTKQQYEPYSTVDKVFQDSYDGTGKFGYTFWIDRSPQA